jgi:hypothetical protein
LYSEDNTNSAICQNIDGSIDVDEVDIMDEVDDVDVMDEVEVVDRYAV